MGNKCVVEAMNVMNQTNPLDSKWSVDRRPCYQGPDESLLMTTTKVDDEDDDEDDDDDDGRRGRRGRKGLGSRWALAPDGSRWASAGAGASVGAEVDVVALMTLSRSWMASRFIF